MVNISYDINLHSKAWMLKQIFWEVTVTNLPFSISPGPVVGTEAWRSTTLQPDVYVWTQLDFMGIHAGYGEEGLVGLLAGSYLDLSG